MVCLDIGANIGAVSLHLASLVGRSGKVYCFEPVPHLHKRLATNSARHANNEALNLFNVALSDRIGEAELSMPRLDYPNQGMGSIVNKDRFLEIRLQVKTTTVDRFVASNGLTHLDLVKMDVQGAEPLILAGATDTLREWRPDLVVEVSHWDLQMGGSSGRAVLATLERLGYQCFFLRQNGLPGSKVCSNEVPADFSCENLYCCPAHRISVPT